MHYLVSGLPFLSIRSRAFRPSTPLLCELEDDESRLPRLFRSSSSLGSGSSALRRRQSPEKLIETPISNGSETCFRIKLAGSPCGAQVQPLWSATLALFPRGPQNPNSLCGSRPRC